MDSTEVATKIYVKANLEKQDLGLMMIELGKMIGGGVDIEKVEETYHKIVSGELKVAQVITSVGLTEEEKEKAKAKVKKNFQGDLVFSFDVDKEILGGMKVKVGDKVLDETVKGKLETIDL